MHACMHACQSFEDNTRPICRFLSAWASWLAFQCPGPSHFDSTFAAQLYRPLGANRSWERFLSSSHLSYQPATKLIAHTLWPYLFSSTRRISLPAGSRSFKPSTLGCILPSAEKLVRVGCHHMPTNPEVRPAMVQCGDIVCAENWAVDLGQWLVVNSVVASFLLPFPEHKQQSLYTIYVLSPKSIPYHAWSFP